jgi:hypothetical protein
VMVFSDLSWDFLWVFEVNRSRLKSQIRVTYCLSPASWPRTVARIAVEGDIKREEI